MRGEFSFFDPAAFYAGCLSACRPGFHSGSAIKASWLTLKIVNRKHKIHLKGKKRQKKTVVSALVAFVFMRFMQRVSVSYCFRLMKSPPSLSIDSYEVGERGGEGYIC